MTRVETLDSPVDLGAWRDRARALLQEDVAPEDVTWRVAEDEPPLPFAAAEEGNGFAGAPSTPPREIRIPKQFMSWADLAICNRDPERFAKLYRLAYRLARNPRLVENMADADVSEIAAMAKEVGRDRHKMTAFVRFRERESQEPRFVAWFEPDHLIEEHIAPFFVDRYASMSFAIFTPRRSVLWSDGQLRFGPGGRPDFPTDQDGFSAAWDAYYRSIFNPARIMPAAMRKEMPKKYWANMPETRQIAPLLAAAAPRVESWKEPKIVAPRKRTPAKPISTTSIPAEPIPQLASEAQTCTRCPLFRDATQVVFGQGAANARMVFVGEQPGDKEDLAGQPFVGPAGALFDEALHAAGVDRSQCYITNAVKHFKFEPRGKIRLHKTPERPEIEACRWWLERELATVTAPLIVAMGATALFALTGEKLKMGENRGKTRPLGEGRIMFTTVHPAFVLRVPDPAVKKAERERFFADIAEAARLSMSNSLLGES